VGGGAGDDRFPCSHTSPRQIKHERSFTAGACDGNRPRRLYQQQDVHIVVLARQHKTSPQFLLFLYYRTWIPFSREKTFRGSQFRRNIPPATSSAQRALLRS
jgi:hypothetical protein